MKIPVTEVPHTYPVDVSTWNLVAIKKLRRIVHKAVNDAIAHACKYNLEVSFPTEWDFDCNDKDGKPLPLLPGIPDDPLTIYVQLPFGKDEFEGPEWSFSLHDVIKEMLSNNHPKNHRGIANIRNALVELVKMIDEKMTPEGFGE